MSDAQSEAWANDPSFSVRSSDDPASKALKAGLKRWVFPGYPTLAAAIIIVLVFQVGWAFVPLCYWLIFWVVAQLACRARAFGLETAQAIGAVRDVLERIGVARADAKATKAERAPPASGIRSFASIPETPPPLTATQYEPPKRRGDPINWNRLIWLGVACAVIFGLMFARDVWRDAFGGPSGAEVAAQARAGVAESNERTAQAEADMGRAVVPIVETHNAARTRVRHEVETTREAIAAAPDLDARYDAYRDLAGRLRDESGAATASAVSEYRAGLDP